MTPKVASPTLVSARTAARVARTDPERPKQLIAPWLRFAQDFRARRADLKGKGVFAAAALEWKALSAQDRARFEEPYKLEKETYRKQFDEYVASGKRDAWKRDPERPKQPSTGFLLFMEDFRVKNAQLSVVEQVRLGAAAWKEMPAAQKAPYEERYAKANATYEAALKAYKSSGKEEQWRVKVGLAQDAAKAKELALSTKGRAQAEARKKAASATLAKARLEVAEARLRAHVAKVAATNSKDPEKTVEAAKVLRALAKAEARKKIAMDKAAEARQGLAEARSKLRSTKAGEVPEVDSAAAVASKPRTPRTKAKVAAAAA